MEQFRTTMSVVFWSDTTDDAEATIAAVTAAVPDEWQESTLSTIEYRAEGPPPPPPEPTE